MTEEFPRYVRLSSNKDDLDPELCYQKLVENEIMHHKYNPNYYTKPWQAHFQKIFDASKVDVNVSQRFKHNVTKKEVSKSVTIEPQSYVISSFKDIRTKNEAKQYKHMISPVTLANNLISQVQDGEVPDKIFQKKFLIQ